MKSVRPVRFPLPILSALSVNAQPAAALTEASDLADAEPSTDASNDPSPSTTPSANAATRTLGSLRPAIQLTLKFQQAQPFGGNGLRLQFIGYRDHRCPTDVQCISAGDAQAVFWVSGPGLTPRVLSLPWNEAPENWRGAARVAGQQLRLVSLEPRPRTSGPIDASAYQAVVAVRPYHALQ